MTAGGNFPAASESSLSLSDNSPSQRVPLGAPREELDWIWLHVPARSDALAAPRVRLPVDHGDPPADRRTEPTVTGRAFLVPPT